MLDLFNYTKDPIAHLKQIRELLIIGRPFQYVRFSDGEIEILCERKLEISEDNVHFRGKNIKSMYSSHDSKKFDPKLDRWLIQKLKHSASYSADTYLKGIPTAHNSLLEKGIMIGFNGGLEKNLTYSDLFMNNNYQLFRIALVPILLQKADLVVANYRSDLSLFTSSNLFKIPDKAFQQAQLLEKHFKALFSNLKPGTIIISSASSLSNIFGCAVAELRPDLTFIDIGTSMNSELGLPIGVRRYQRSYSIKHPLLSIRFLKYKMSRAYKIKW